MKHSNELHPAIASLLASKLQSPGGEWVAVDPCCGNGLAIRSLVQGLGGDGLVLAAELDTGQAAAAETNLSDFKRLVVTSNFLSMRLTAQSASLCYAFPPAATNELGYANNIELEFLYRCTSLLKPTGVLVAVVNERLLSQRYHYEPQFLKALCRSYVDVTLCPADNGLTIAMGYRRRDLVNQNPATPRTCALKDCNVYSLPPARHGDIRSFTKTEPTDQELERMLATSPLGRLFEPPAEPALRRPPLSLGSQHIALLLASGQLDGVVNAPSVHVVRGVAYKEQYIRESSEKVDDKGNTKTVNTFSERLKVKVRAVHSNGEIRDYT